MKIYVQLYLWVADPSEHIVVGIYSKTAKAEFKMV